jgi:hypothetical protein
MCKGLKAHFIKYFTALIDQKPETSFPEHFSTGNPQEVRSPRHYSTGNPQEVRLFLELFGLAKLSQPEFVQACEVICSGRDV